MIHNSKLLLQLLPTTKLLTVDVFPQPTNPQAYVDKLLHSSASRHLTITNVQFTGHPTCAGLYKGGVAAVTDDATGEIVWPTATAGGPFADQGVVLATGQAAALAFQNSDFTTTDHQTAGDADLDGLAANRPTRDACVVEFDFVCNVASTTTTDPCTLAIDYIFGSEEYKEFASPGADVNDIFGIFLDGQNLAIVPGTNDNASVSTINQSTNSQFYIDNDPGLNDDLFYVDTYFDDIHVILNQDVPFPKLECDGFTTRLTATASDVTPNTVHRFKLVIADRFDGLFDSFLLFPEDSLRATAPVPPAGGGGDPHIRRWQATKRDSFHGECDLVMLQSRNHGDDNSNINNNGLDMHIRTTMDVDTGSYSYIEAAALRIAGKHVVEVQKGRIVLDGVSYTDDQLPLEFGKSDNDDNKKNHPYKIYLNHKEVHDTGRIRRRHYRLRLNDNSDNSTMEIEFRFYQNILTFDIQGHDGWLADSLGLLGQYPTGHMVARDGQSVFGPDDFVQFGFEWQVNPYEDGPSLFQDLREPQLPYEQCRMSSDPGDNILGLSVKRKQKGRRRLLRGEEEQDREEVKQLHQDASKACAKQTSNGDDLQLCVNDVMLTGDIELAQEW